MNYVVRFLYNGKEYSAPANSEQFSVELKAGTDDIIIRDCAENVAKDYLEKNGLRKEGCSIKRLQMQDENGKLIYAAQE